MCFMATYVRAIQMIVSNSTQIGMVRTALVRASKVSIIPPATWDTCGFHPPTCLKRRKMGNIAKVVLLATTTFFFVGCANIYPPNWCSPGTARQQQLIAEQYDPYPENDIAPAVVGGRPLGYMNPPAETLRARWPLGTKPGASCPPAGR